MSLTELEIRQHTAPIEKELNHQKEKNGRLKKEKKELYRALKNLIERLNFVHESQEYKSVWEVNQLHSGQYTGPTYTEAFEEAERLLNERQETEDHP